MALMGPFFHARESSQRPALLLWSYRRFPALWLVVLPVVLTLCGSLWSDRYFRAFWLHGLTDIFELSGSVVLPDFSSFLALWSSRGSHGAGGPFLSRS